MISIRSHMLMALTSFVETQLVEVLFEARVRGDAAHLTAKYAAGDSLRDPRRGLGRADRSATSPREHHARGRSRPRPRAKWEGSQVA